MDSIEQALLWAVFAVPLACALFAALLPWRRGVEAAALTGAGLAFASAVWLGLHIKTHGAIAPIGLFAADPLSAFEAILISGVGLVVMVYSLGYIGHEYDAGEIDLGKLRQYYGLLTAFIGVLMGLTVADNLGVFWIVLEASTLVSAFLVAFHSREPHALEAAYKYVVLCSVGIALALLGVVLTFAAAPRTVPAEDALSWAALVQAANLDPKLMKLAFVFIVIGYGTKAGIAPMHTWLPDAHSMAPSPVSALLSGVVLNAALYGILRFHRIAAVAVGDGWSQNVLLAFGVLSLVVAAPFVLVQKDLKRLLAYSSVEHTGIALVGLGLGGPGVYAALLHIVNHAAAKSLMFFTAGDLVQRFRSREVGVIAGAVRAAPGTAVLFVAGTFALAGMPPFGLFVSELRILVQGFASERWGVVGVMLVAIAVVFAALLRAMQTVALGDPPPGEHEARTGATAGPGAARAGAGTLGWTAAAVVGGCALLLGVWIPLPLHELIVAAAKVVLP